MRHVLGLDRSTGQRGETLAARFLARKGIRITHRNYRTSLGEIDLVGRQRGTVVIIEVKTREADDHGDPWQAVGPDKQRRLSRLAVQYIKEQRLGSVPVRFDVVSVILGENQRIEHFEAAFDARGPWNI